MPETVQCPVCHKSYVMKPEFAGKRMKCKCGEKFSFPTAGPSAAATPGKEEVKSPKNAPAAKEADAGEYDIIGEKKAAPVLDVPKGHCRGCRKPLADGAVICTACGYNQS